MAPPQHRPGGHARAHGHPVRGHVLGEPPRVTSDISPSTPSNPSAYQHDPRPSSLTCTRTLSHTSPPPPQNNSGATSRFHWRTSSLMRQNPSWTYCTIGSGWQTTHARKSATTPRRSRGRTWASLANDFLPPTASTYDGTTPSPHDACLRSCLATTGARCSKQGAACGHCERRRRGSTRCARPTGLFARRGAGAVLTSTSHVAFNLISQTTQRLALACSPGAARDRPLAR